MSESIEQAPSPAPRTSEALERVYLDTETTALWPGDIVEVAIVADDGSVLLDTRCKPTCEITEGAQEVHGISMEDLVDAPASADVKAQVAWIVHGKHVVIYNAAFDKRFVDLRGAAKVSCCMVAFAAYYADWSDYHGNYRWQKLTTAARIAGHDWTATPHGALTDAQACRTVWQSLPRLQAEKEVEEAALVHEYRLGCISPLASRLI